MRVECYWNLHKGGWSVRGIDRAHPVYYNKVIAVVPEIYICDPKFVVRPAGNARVRREGKKNVHAFVRGNYYLLFGEGEVANEHGVTYNPYVNTSFVNREDGDPVYEADLAHLYTNEEGKGKVKARWYRQPSGEVCQEVQQGACPPRQEEGAEEARPQR